ncbi:MAG: bifunctional diaminohydroxyphosphoribosylaminopyrimidine deaminase/5-amino-6-(5-phosphoribosylamino)uracil reductase RibD [Tannerellaceae bacterium]|jgi:diaminohydroxyphosphoribosylaminopyrimidine deaminase/5-amino-6-(5-phosphoribosylamino)uracil reductase|nr:bifunctional diaminohydroxyphosphoribosylaminopyrimidine deaminase/5-amino-6-(5-phosphoribosylamino)uracil reductase RibD [Tannerellaceae bacterium]
MNPNEIEDKYMARCIALARHGLGKVSPNPMVGAVIVHRGEIIGEGYHRKWGEAHAEVNAVASVRDESLLPEATLYVNLEPCSHHGQTPPCTDLIIRTRIPRVVVACPDPYPDVAGRGIRRLREAGVEVTTGVLADEALALNKVFITNHTRKRPYVYLKWAQSADGFIDKVRVDASAPPVRFSSPATLQLVHKKRAEVDAIMVGTHTALLDNPSLTMRYWSGASPVRVALDRQLRIPPHYHLLDDSVRTLVFTAMERENTRRTEYIRIDFGSDVLRQVLSHLYHLKLMSLLVEGGAVLLNHFLQEELWDEVQVETASFCLGDGVKAPIFIPREGK